VFTDAWRQPAAAAADDAECSPHPHPGLIPHPGPQSESMAAIRRCWLANQATNRYWPAPLRHVTCFRSLSPAISAVIWWRHSTSRDKELEQDLSLKGSKPTKQFSTEQYTKDMIRDRIASPVRRQKAIKDCTSGPTRPGFAVLRLVARATSKMSFQSTNRSKYSPLTIMASGLNLR